MSQQMAQDSMAMHQIALASKNIAEATKRDSHAMKTIGSSFSREKSAHPFLSTPFVCLFFIHLI